MREAVKEFLIDHLKEIAIEKSFKGETTGGIQEAKKAIDDAFTRLVSLYKRDVTPKKENAAR